jgi:hypothetical protein
MALYIAYYIASGKLNWSRPKPFQRMEESSLEL